MQLQVQLRSPVNSKNGTELCLWIVQNWVDITFFLALPTYATMW